MQAARDASAGLIAVMAAITMFFSALVSAGFVRRGLSSDWVTTSLPDALWMSAGLMLIAWILIELDRRRPGAAFGGVAFAFCALIRLPSVWQGGGSLANPAVAFLCVITAALACCSLGGIVAVLRTRTALGVVLYWRFLAVLWIFLAVVLNVWN